MTKADEKIRLRATDGSMYNVDIKSSGLVDTIRCNNKGDTSYCELQIEAQLPDVEGGEFDRVQIGSDMETNVTLNASHENFDTHITGFGYCAEVEIEAEEPFKTAPGDGDRRLVCVDTSLLRD